jgi:hypothetical protein
MHIAREAVKINGKCQSTMIIVKVWRHKVCSQLSRDLKRCIVKYDLGVGDFRLNISESNIYETSFKGQGIMYRLQWEEGLSSRNSNINALKKHKSSSYV